MTKQSMTKIKQPTGVSITAILQTSSGIIVILIGLALLNLRKELTSNGDGGISWTFLVIIFLLGFGAIIVGVGLWTMKKWCFQVARIFTIIFFLLAILLLPLGFILLILDVIILYLLIKPEIKEAFEIIDFMS
ncbi:MAG: hypothetical protein ACE5R6_15230 [Candidatus Heimdallarchaeota archaeon]